MDWREIIAELACPACRQALQITGSGDSERLVCDGCRRAYPVRDNIPILLIDEAVQR